MKVTFLAEKYKTGSEKGLSAHEKKGILDNLNLVIDFDGSTYPGKWVETEDKKAYHKTTMTRTETLGEKGILKPGDMFVYEGQIFAIDRPDRLILCLSESGPLAVKRFVEEILETEVKLEKGDPEFGEGEVMMKELDSLPADIPEDEEPYCIPYYLEKCWRDKKGWPKNFQVTFSTNLSFLPVRLFIKGNQVWYYPEETDPDMIPDLTFEFLSRTWNEKHTEKGVED